MSFDRLFDKMSSEEAGYLRSLMDTDLSHEAIERFSAIEARLDALEGTPEEPPANGEESPVVGEEGQEEDQDEEDEGTGGIV